MRPVVLFVLGLSLGACAVQRGPAPAVTGEVARIQKPAPSTGTPSEESLRAELIYELLVADLAARQGDLETALRNYLDVARTSRDPQVARQAVRLAVLARKPKKALEAARLWVELAPDSLEPQRVLGVLLVRNGLIDEAVQTYENLIAREAEPGPAILHVAAMLRRETDKDGALRVMRDLAQKYPNVPEAHYALASTAHWAGDADLALKEIEEALRLKPEWTAAVVLKARILVGARDLDAAIAYLQSYLTDHPKATSVRLELARRLVDARRLKAAREQFETLAAQTPDDPDVLYALAMLAMQFGDVEEAKGYLEHLYKLGKRVQAAAYFLGQVAEEQQRWEDALRWYRKVRRGEYRLDAQLRIAAILARLKGLDEALDYLDQVPLTNLDEVRRIYLFKASLLQEYKRYQAAFALLSEALTRIPDDPQILYARALVAERLDKLDVAEADLRKILEQEPKNAAALNALGYTLADRTDRLEEARKLIEAAYELQPDDPAIIDSMGWVRYREGDLEGAERYLRQAYERLDDAEIAAHLGEVLWRLGKQDEARAILRKALEKDPDDEVLRATIERLGLDLK